MIALFELLTKVCGPFLSFQPDRLVYIDTLHFPECNTLLDFSEVQLKFTSEELFGSERGNHKISRTLTHSKPAIKYTVFHQSAGSSQCSILYASNYFINTLYLFLYTFFSVKNAAAALLHETLTVHRSSEGLAALQIKTSSNTEDIKLKL